MCGCNLSIKDIQSLIIIITIISVLGSSSRPAPSTISPRSVLEKSSSNFLLLLNFNSMATIAKFSAIKPTYADLASITKTSYTFFSFLPNCKPKYCKQNLAVASNFVNSRRQVIKATSSSAASSGAVKKSTEEKGDERVQKVHSIEEFDEALRVAKNKLVVVEYAASHSLNSSKIYPFMVDLSRTCSDVNFLLVMGDESEKTQELCKREKIDRVPHFTFYKNMEKIHEEEGIGPDQLVGDVLYYGDNHSAVVQLHSREDVEKLIDEHKTDNKLIVLDVGLKHCGPCVKVYPTVLKLSKQMDAVVFARMNGDENESCMQFLKDMDVIQVPTFLFIRDGEICGRYVGSGKGELIGEILRYQGVRVT